MKYVMYFGELSWLRSEMMVIVNHNVDDQTFQIQRTIRGCRIGPRSADQDFLQIQTCTNFFRFVPAVIGDLPAVRMPIEVSWGRQRQLGARGIRDIIRMRCSRRYPDWMFYLIDMAPDLS